MEFIDARTAIWIAIVFVGMGVSWGIQITTTGAIRREVKGLKKDLTAIGSKFDKAKEKADSRYMAQCMAMVALKMVMPVGNPHNAEVSKLVDNLSKENGST